MVAAAMTARLRGNESLCMGWGFLVGEDLAAAQVLAQALRRIDRLKTGRGDLGEIKRTVLWARCDVRFVGEILGQRESPRYHRSTTASGWLPCRCFVSAGLRGNRWYESETDEGSSYFRPQRNKADRVIES